MPPSSPSTRDLRIDFFRGLALIFIFWDHITGSFFGYFTMRNLGFSDAAELFVFLSGVSAAIAYGKRLQRRGYVSTTMHILSRSWTLYIAHVFVLTQLMAMLFLVNDHVLTRDYVNEMGLSYFLENPKAALVASSLLRFRPGLMDPLPLYIVLLAMMVVVLPFLLRRPRWVLLASGALYLLATFNEWNFEARPNKEWFFNPFTWQFLFFIGALVGSHREANAQWLARCSVWLRQRLLWGALAFLANCAVVTVSWSWPAWHDSWMPLPVAELLYPISKSYLGGARLLHFLALVLVAVLLLPQGKWLDGKFSQALQMMGRHTLPVFCVSVLLSPMADALNAIEGDDWWMQCITAVLGVVLLWAVAQLLEWYRRDESKA